MARQSFQARLRTYNGRQVSNMDIRTKTLLPILAQNFYGPMQIVLVNPANALKVVGMMPAFWELTKIEVLTPGGAGTFRIDLPLYRGMAAVNLVAAATVATATGNIAIAAGGYASYPQDRPIEITPAGTITGTFRVGLFGVPLDDGAGSLI